MGLGTAGKSRAGSRTGIVGQALSKIVGLPPGLSDERVHNRFAEKPINTNVNAMVHLHLSAMMLEYLVARKVINFGDSTSKEDEATEIIKANKTFVHEMTQKHQAGEHIDQDAFDAEVQVLVNRTLNKLNAILTTGKTRLGSPDSELAEPMSYPLKICCAICIDDLCKLFDIDNIIQDVCDQFIIHDKNLAGNDVYEDYLEFLKGSIRRGNGTRSFTYIRIAVTSIVSLYREGKGVDRIQDRVAKSLIDNGPLENVEIDLSDIPEFEEEFENLNATFADETLHLNLHGGTIAMIGTALIDTIFSNLEFDEEATRKINKLIAEHRKSRGERRGTDPGEIDEADRKAFLTDMHFRFIVIQQGYIDGSDRLTSEERLSKLKTDLGFVPAILDLVCALDPIVNMGRVITHLGVITNDTSTTINDEFAKQVQAALASGKVDVSWETQVSATSFESKVVKLDDTAQALLRGFLRNASDLVGAMVQRGSAEISDRNVRPTDNRIPYFLDCANYVKKIKRDTRENLIGDARKLVLRGEEDAPFNKQFDLVMKLLVFFSNMAFHERRKGGKK